MARMNEVNAFFFWFIELIKLMKIFTFFLRREDPRILILLVGEIFFCLFIYVFELNGSFLFVKYSGDNSVICFISSYIRDSLRPRCWIICSVWSSILTRGAVRPLNCYMIWVQVGVSQTGFYLKDSFLFTVRKDLIFQLFC
jgi:hypothetical protein